MNFEELWASEPKVRSVASQIAKLQPTERFCVNAVWYADGGFRQQLEYLEWKFGWQEHGMAYSVLYDLLPDCQPGCACSRGRA